MSSRQAAVRGVVVAIIAISAAAVITTHWLEPSDGAVTARPPAQGAEAAPSPSPFSRVTTVAPAPSPSPFSRVTAVTPSPSVAGAPVPSTPSSSRPQPIQQGEATRIAIPDIGYHAAVGQMPTDANGEVNPPTLQDTYRITNRGVAPGAKATNTVYLACHSISRGFAPCNVVFQRAKPGQHLLLTTPSGTLDYVIQVTRLYAKTGEFKNSDEVRQAVPGRLVLVTCLQKNNGSASTHNFVVFAQLTK